MKLSDINQATVDALPGNIYWKNTQGVYQGCNTKMAEILGLNSPEEIKGKTALELLGNENKNLAEEIEATDNKVMRENREVALEEEGYGIKYLSNKKPLLGEDGEVVGMIGISLPQPNQN